MYNPFLYVFDILPHDKIHYLEQTRMLFTISSIPSISAAQPHIHVSGKLHIFFLMHKPPNIDQLWCA